MIHPDFNIVFFFGGGGGEAGGSFCSCQCFQELYLETRHGNVHFFLTFLFMIVGRADSTCKGLRNYCDHPYLLVKSRTLYTFFNAREVDY